jgi:hypothetical protein
MFTVRHIYNCMEQIFSATSVSYQGPTTVEGTPEPASLRCYYGGGETYLQTGRVFVMNDAGKTVANYDFDDINDPNRQITAGTLR